MCSSTGLYGLVIYTYMHNRHLLLGEDKACRLRFIYDAGDMHFNSSTTIDGLLDTVRQDTPYSYQNIARMLHPSVS